MGSIAESVGSDRSNVRRYPLFQTRLQRWNNGSSNGELPPQLQKVRTHVTRTPALDVAQQAQLAACNYLGYSPRDLPNDIFRPQGSPSDRPLELHMHHYHHHYVSPTRPFPQSSSQRCEGTAGESTGGATTKLAIRADSPVLALPNTNATTIYPALALRASSALPQLIGTLHGHVQNQSQNGSSMGDVEAAQRYMQNILWLKNQIDHGPDRAMKHWQERRGENAVGSETRITRRDLRSPDSGCTRPITGDRRPIRPVKKFLWPRDGDDSEDSSSAGEDACRTKLKSRTTGDSALLLEKCEKMRAFRNNTSPCNSLSEDNSITDDSARSVSLPPPVKCQKSPSVCLKIRKTKMIENGEAVSTTEPSSQQICKLQGILKPQGCLVCPSWPLTRGRKSKSCRARTPCEDTASSPENNSVCSSGQVSIHRSTWTHPSSDTESDTQPKEWSPRGRPAKKGCGARACRRQASRDAKVWEKIDRRPRKISCCANARLEAGVQAEYVDEMDTETKAEGEDLEDRDMNVPDENSCLQDRCTQEKEREDISKSRVQRSGSQTRLQTAVETSRKTNITEHLEKVWTPSLGSNRGLQHFSGEYEGIGKDEPSLDEERHRCYSPRTADNKIGGNLSHNRLREAIEAAWNTNLGTTRGLGDYCVNISQGHKCTDQAFPSEIVHGDAKINTLLPISAERKAHSCPWKVHLGMKNGVEEDSRNKAPADPIFQNIHRDHENLRALVAREECLQRELKDQTVARVAAEERARVAAEEKAHIYEASAKAAEEGLRVLLDERALFHCKFKEELEKGATDRLRLQELLHLEKLKLESTESELREVRRSFQDSLAVGTRALPSKNMLQDPRLDGLSVHAVAPHGLGAGHDEARLQLMAESDSRIAAEAKASHFETSAKAADERLRSLLDERNWFSSRFKEELEQNNTDMKKLQHLMELEKSNNGLAQVSEKKKVDVKLVGLGLARRNLDIKTEDGQSAPQRGVHVRTSFRSRLEDELVPDDKNRHRLGPSLEFEEPPDERSQSYCTCDPETSDYKQAEDCFGEDQKSVSSIDTFEKKDVRYMRASVENSSIKNEKKRPLSPMNGSRVRHWKSADGPLSVKVEMCKGRDGETRTVLDISPGSSRLDAVDHRFRENPKSPKAYRLAAGDSLDFKENSFHFRKLAGLALENCAQRPHVNGGPPMTLPSKWKKDTKAELRRMLQEQEMTWKIAEDAVEELGRRLELLERYKMEIEDTLGRTKAIGNIDRFFKRLQENLGDGPRGFNSLYNSPIYEEGKSFYNCPIFLEKKGGRATYQDVCTSPTRPDISKDSEIEKLKIQVAHLRVELQQRDCKGPNSPKMKNAFKFSPRSPTSPRIPTSRPIVADTDWSAHALSGFETPLKKEDIPQLHLISQGNPTTPELIPEVVELELGNDSFDELKTSTIHAIQNNSMQNFSGRVNSFERIDNFSLGKMGLEVGDRGCVPIPDGSRDNGTAQMCMENGTCQIEEMDHQEKGGPQEDVFLSVDLNSDEGELRVLKTAVRKLSRLFWEQEEKFKKFKRRDKKEDVNTSQAEEGRDLYVDMVKEMSRQLGELCHKLRKKTRTEEVLHKQERAIRKCCPSQKVEQKFQHTEMMDPLAATTKDVESGQLLQIEDEDTCLVSTDKLKCGAKQSLNEEEDRPENSMAGSENLRTLLQAAEKKIQEQMSTNLSLSQKLESGSQSLSKMQAEHVEEVARKDHSINYAQQLNFDLTNEMSQTESSLADIRLRYKSLVSSLEQQLEDAKKEAISLQDTVHILKEEIARKENLVSSLEAEAKEHERQIELLRTQIEVSQNGTDENVREKLELLHSLEAMRREIDEQQHRVTELIRINEDLIVFSESKEGEITGLKTTIKSLQQSVDEKSAEAAKLSAEASACSLEVAERRKEGETYRLRHTALKSKLEEIEHELLAREASMERLTQHLGKTIEGQDFILAEKEQLLLSLNRAQYKEHRLDDQVRQSKIIVQDLEDKLNSMDAVMNEARLEMAEMKAKGQEALLIEQQAGEMRNRVHELEEEIMEKEGQISILKTSYPGEYASTF